MDNKQARGLPHQTPQVTTQPRLDRLSRHTTGTSLVAIASVVLLVLNLILTAQEIEAARGVAGTEYSGLLLEPLVLLGLLVVLGSLLTTALRRTQLPPAVRRKRLVFSLLGCSSLLLPWAASSLLA